MGPQAHITIVQSSKNKEKPTNEQQQANASPRPPLSVPYRGAQYHCPLLHCLVHLCCARSSSTKERCGIPTSIARFLILLLECLFASCTSHRFQSATTQKGVKLKLEVISPLPSLPPFCSFSPLPGERGSRSRLSSLRMSFSGYTHISYNHITMSIAKRIYLNTLRDDISPVEGSAKLPFMAYEKKFCVKKASVEGNILALLGQCDHLSAHIA